MGPTTPLFNHALPIGATSTPSRVDADATPAPAIQADVPETTRTTLRTQLPTSVEPPAEPRAQLEEGPGAERRRIHLSTEEFAVRRRARFRASEDARQPIPGSLPPRLGARLYASHASR